VERLVEGSMTFAVEEYDDDRAAARLAWLAQGDHASLNQACDVCLSYTDLDLAIRGRAVGRLARVRYGDPLADRHRSSEPGHEESVDPFTVTWELHKAAGRVVSGATKGLSWLLRSPRHPPAGGTLLPDHPPAGMGPFPDDVWVQPGWYWVEALDGGMALRVEGPYTIVNGEPELADLFHEGEVYHRQGDPPPPGWYWIEPPSGPNDPLILIGPGGSGREYRVYG
jgi:hypothetical protein